MHSLTILLGILAALLIGVISPGPSFLLVARTSVAQSRRAGLIAALGMACGATVMALIALLGLHALLQSVPVLYTVLKVTGGIYLLYLAWQVWRGAATPLQVQGDGLPVQALTRTFWQAAATMLSNPKAAVQYGVIFAAMLPAHPEPGLLLMLPPAVFLLEGGWYTLVALLLSSEAPRQQYLRAKTGIDRVAGAVLALLGIKLLLSRQ